MKANELRIGNLVSETPKYAEGFIRKIVALHENDAWFENGDFEQYENVYPLKITEEWMYKFGFKKKEDYDDELGDLYDLEWWGGFYLKEDYFIPKPYYFAEAFNYDFKLKYVHQLQNIYFALTGEELEVSPVETA